MAIALTFVKNYYLAGRNTTNLYCLFRFIVINHSYVDISATLS
jgi:hypothetical protein